MNQQVLAHALQALFEKTDFFTLPEWSRFFGVPLNNIEEWISGEQLPGPHVIWMLIDVLECHDVNQGPVKALKTLYQTPLREITSCASERIGSLTLAKYIDFMRFSAREEIGDIKIGSLIRTISDPPLTGIVTHIYPEYPEQNTWSICMRDENGEEHRIPENNVLVSK